jgi:hypothetical protein
MVMNVNFVVEQICSEIKRTETSYIRKIAARVLGVNLDSWGDVKDVSSELVASLSKRKEIQASMKAVEEKIVEEACKPFSQKSIQEIAKRVRSKILDQVEARVYTVISSKLETIIYAEVEAQIKKNPKLSAYLIAGQIIDSTKK